MERFEDLIENDCFKLATYLDPVFGPKAFRPEARVQVKERLKLHIGLLNPEIQISLRVQFLRIILFIRK